MQEFVGVVARGEVWRMDCGTEGESCCPSCVRSGKLGLQNERSSRTSEWFDAIQNTCSSQNTSQEQPTPSSCPHSFKLSRREAPTKIHSLIHIHSNSSLALLNLSPSLIRTQSIPPPALAWTFHPAYLPIPHPTQASSPGLPFSPSPGPQIRGRNRGGSWACIVEECGMTPSFFFSRRKRKKKKKKVWKRCFRGLGFEKWKWKWKWMDGNEWLVGRLGGKRPPIWMTLYMISFTKRFGCGADYHPGMLWLLEWKATSKC